MSKAVKLADIGKQLGVSTVTVSKALSGQRGVSEELRAKIRQLADEMGYVKSTQDKSKERRSYTIGVAVAERYLGGPSSFYLRMYQELSQKAIRKNCFAMLEVISFDEEHEVRLPKMVKEEKADAVVLMGTFTLEYTKFLRKNVCLPLILLDTLANEEDTDSVVSNNMMGAYRMTNYLFRMGHSKIGFVGTRLATTSIDDRFFGYLKSLMQHGVPLREDWLIEDRDRKTGAGDYDRYFKLPPKEEMPTAFFCNNDMAALAMVRRLTENGYAVPDDISIVGFDNFINESFPQIGITTYAIKIREMAGRAIHILLHKLENPDYKTGVYMIDGEFIERDSAKRIGEEVPFI
jgi:LacI family transcriptional regulator/LacI family purine nucleotide synthesis repressor